MAQHHITSGDPATAIRVLREAVAHSGDAGNMMSNISAIGVAIVALAGVGHDVAGGTCAGALLAGVFAPFVIIDGIPAIHQALATLRDNLGPERCDAAYTRGTSANYDEIAAFMLATFDEIMAESS